MTEVLNEKCVNCKKDCKQLKIIKIVNCKYYESKNKNATNAEEGK